ncbi:hypothetical protein BD311DRAFT_806920 [Dichomitus squalens]|uniref:Uncharacterized protein n=1 Tax=Dichomitus squalens TaxID=114155 RepID=A0A4Q9MNG5_9APHY|nr:hypothetical protein BD311DRAFT_806920 [Dichomitus squalens]
MSSIVNKIKQKTTGKDNTNSDSAPTQGSQPTYSIQPHPAKTNDPRDLEPPQPGGGLNSNPEYGAFHARDPYIPPAHIANNLPPPQTREQLRARQAELNKD